MGFKLDKRQRHDAIARSSGLVGRDKGNGAMDYLDPLDISGYGATKKNSEEQRKAAEQAVAEMATATQAAYDSQKRANDAAIKAQQEATDSSIAEAERAARDAEAYIVEANRTALAARRAGADFSNAEFQKSFDFIEQKLNPWIKSGTQANDQIQALMGFKGEAAAKNALVTDPSYQFRKKEGEQAVERSAAARGGLFSGRTGVALQERGQDTASKEFDNVFRRLMSVSEQGRSASSEVGSYRWKLGDVRSANEYGVRDMEAQGAMNLANTKTRGSDRLADTRTMGYQGKANVTMQGEQNLANIEGSNAFANAAARTGRDWQNVNANTMENNFAPNTARSLVGDATGVISAFRGGSGNGRNTEYQGGTSGTGPYSSGYRYDDENYDNDRFRDRDNENVWGSPQYNSVYGRG